MVKIVRYASLLLLLGPVIPLACSTAPTVIDNTCPPPVACEELVDCYSEGNYQLGTECRNNLCLCPEWEGMSRQPCCLRGADPFHCKRQCRPIEDCAPEPCLGSTGETTASSSGVGGEGTGGAGGEGGAGGAGGEGGSSGGECDEPSDCGAIDPLCGAVACEDHRCVFDIKTGPIASQLRGDCKRRDCDVTGQVVTFDDPSDWYNDGKECTLDYCLFDPGTQLSKPVNDPAWDGFGCPETGAGVCYSGKCIECLEVIGEVCGDGFTCDSFYCVPVICTQQVNGMVDSPLETGVDCGGSCHPCFHPQGCKEAAHCVDGVCMGGKCALPTHSDGVKNDNETGIDCGCLNCALCPDDFECEVNNNCKSGICWGGKCQAPACNDGRHNGEETGTDCGAACNTSCP